MRPDSKEIERLAEEYSVIPVCREIYADITTPIILLRKIAEISDRYFLLESVEGGEKWGRYSFMGFDPSMRVSCRKGCVKIEKDGKTDVIKTDDPLNVIRDILKGYKAPRLEGMPPFTGGFVGYFGYAMIGYAEPVLDISTDEYNDYDVCLYDRVIAYDHLKQKISIIANMKTDNVLENYGRAVAEITKIEAIIKSQPIFNNEKKRTAIEPEFSCNVTKEE